MGLIAAIAGLALTLALALAYAWRRRRRATEPQPPAYLYPIALEHYEAGRMAEAEAALRLCIQAAPGFPEAHFKLGNVLAYGGRLADAEAAFRQALSLKPDYHQAHNNLGNLLRMGGRADEAEACFRRAIECEADFPEAASNLAIMLAEAGRTKEAEAAFRRALAANPERFDLHFNLAQLLADDGRPGEAEAVYRETLRLNPDFAAAANALGLLLAQAGHPSEAADCFRDALRLNPDNLPILGRLGLALTDCGRYGEAEAAYRQALASKPDDVAALTNYAIVLVKTGRMAEAEDYYRQALTVQPDQPETLNNLGALYLETGRWEEAEVVYRLALDIAPTPAMTLNFAHLRMLQGDYAHGWEGFENRFQVTSPAHDLRRFAQPRWDGQAYPGKTLLVYFEEGLGDSLQFFRFLPQAAALGGRLQVECPQPLYRLFRANLPAETGLFVRGQDALPSFDVYCPLMSLPLHLKTRLETIPAQTPYLRTPAEAAANCPALPPAPGAPARVGLVWAGNLLHRNDHNRSLDFALLEPLFAIPCITWVILQKERRPQGLAELARQRGWLDPLGQAQDFADTAAIIDQLDLVIGVDTSVIHLAGALGKPAWLLLPLAPDWRWLLERDDTPWYPGMRLFRQTEYQNWPPTVRRVADALAAWRGSFDSRTQEA